MANLAIFTIIQDDGNTITLNADQQAAPFYGYHLIDYGPQIGTLEIARNGSPYADGSRIVNQRSNNIVEQYRMDIVGQSPDDALAKLAALYQLVYWARDAQINPGMLIPPGITYSIPGATRSGFAYILNGTVSESPQTPRLNIEGNRIKGIVLTIERTRWYRSSGSNAPNIITYKSVGDVAIWGVIGIDNVTYGSVPGDVPARVGLHFASAHASNPIGKLVLGYRSNQRNRDGYTDDTTITTPLIVEAESASVTRTNFTTGSSATASPGTGTTYASTTAATAKMVFQFNTALGRSPTGRFRVFARMLSTVGGSGNVALTNLNGASRATQVFAPVTVNVNAWRMYDLGVFSLPSAPTLFGAPGGHFGYLQIDFSGISGALWVDCFLFVPCDEYYLTLTLKDDVTLASAFPVLYNNIVIPTAAAAYYSTLSLTAITTVQRAGEILIPPGKGTFFWIGMTNVNGNVFTGTNADMQLGLKVAPQYETAPTS